MMCMYVCMCVCVCVCVCVCLYQHNMDGVEGKAQYAWCDYDLNPSC